MRPKTFLQCFALEQRESEAKHYKNILGRILGRKTRYKISPQDSRKNQRAVHD